MAMGNCSSDSYYKPRENNTPESTASVKSSTESIPDTTATTTSSPNARKTSPDIHERADIDSKAENSKTCKNSSKSSKKPSGDREETKASSDICTKSASYLEDRGRVPRVLVHPICVGQGDAILLEIQRENGKRERHLIDGGRGQRTQNKHFYTHLKEALREHGCIEKAVGNAMGGKLEDRCCDRVIPDSIIITHPNEDHYGGINRLLENFTVTSPIVTTEATCIYTEHTSPGVTGHRVGDTFQPCSTNLVQHWFPATQGGRHHTYIKTLPKGTRVISTKNPDFRGDLNKSSVLTTVSLPGSKYDFDVVLTGDSESYLIQRALKLEGKSVGVFQVPHHGSRSNYSFQCTRFYSSFTADIYLISHGDHKGFNHPHKEVITGILTAAVQKRRHCKIVVTATKFDQSKIADTEHIRNWRDYVEIYHFKQNTPFVTLEPTVEQAPQGLQLYTEKVNLEDKLADLKLQRKTVSHDANSFFSAVSRALMDKYSRTITPIQLREELVEHLLQQKDIYYPQSGLSTMDEFYHKASEYLLDGHSSPEIDKVIPQAMAETLKIRIHVISANFAEDLSFGHEHSQTVIQLVYDASGCGHYDYALSTHNAEFASRQDHTIPSYERKDKREHTPSKELPQAHRMSNSTSRQLFYTHQSVEKKGEIPRDEGERISPMKSVCCICKQQISPTDQLFRCSNKKCLVKTHHSCEYESRKKRTFVRNFSKCEYCRTCKECKIVMGGTKFMCRSCDSYVHAECMRQVGTQRQEVYKCINCR